MERGTHVIDCADFVVQLRRNVNTLWRTTALKL